MSEKEEKKAKNFWLHLCVISDGYDGIWDLVCSASTGCNHFLKVEKIFFSVTHPKQIFLLPKMKVFLAMAAAAAPSMRSCCCWCCWCSSCCGRRRWCCCWWIRRLRSTTPIGRAIVAVYVITSISNNTIGVTLFAEQPCWTNRTAVGGRIGRNVELFKGKNAFLCCFLSTRWEMSKTFLELLKGGNEGKSL